MEIAFRSLDHAINQRVAELDLRDQSDREAKAILDGKRAQAVHDLIQRFRAIVMERWCVIFTADQVAKWTVNASFDGEKVQTFDIEIPVGNGTLSVWNRDGEMLRPADLEGEPIFSFFAEKFPTDQAAYIGNDFIAAATYAAVGRK